MNFNFVPRWVRLLFLVGIGLVGILAYTQLLYAATNWYVTPGGAGNQDGRSWNTAFATIQKALDVAQPGDTIFLGNGEYRESIITKRHGTVNAPISLVGSSGAIVRGSPSQDRVFQIQHDYYLLDGWTIDGYDGSGNSAGDYRDKLLYVHGQSGPYGGAVRRGPAGLEVRNMRFQNAGGECIRLRYFVQGANIHHNTILNCGLYDFVFHEGGKNGEGIYIGTSSNQWNDGKNPTNEPDQSSFNHVHHNYFDTQGNECIEVKEGGSGNLIEHNECTGSRDPEAAGLVSRGDGNIFRYNLTYGHAGGGLRFGGNTINGYRYGVNNAAYGNTIYSNSSGGIKFENRPQGQICGNSFQGPQGEAQRNPTFGSYASDFTQQVNATCPQGTSPTQTPTQTAIPATPTATSTHTSVPATATATETATPLAPDTPTATPTATATNTQVPPSATATPTASATATATSPNVPELPSATPTATATPIDAPAAQTSLIYYFSAESSGTVGGIQFRDEDIVSLDPATGRWWLLFDGSDVGLADADIDALDIRPDGAFLLSFVDNTNVPGVGRVDDSDIVRFVPTRLGTTTAGSFELYFDGSDVGLSQDSEDIDALSVLQDGRLLLSTTGNYTVGRLTGDDEDLLLFTPTRLGSSTVGSWSRYFDGETIGLSRNTDEDLFNLWVDQTTPGAVTLVLGTRKAHTVGPLSGDNQDLFQCTLAANTCTPQYFWQGKDYGFPNVRINAFAVTNFTVFNAMQISEEPNNENVGAEDNVDPTDLESELDESAETALEAGENEGLLEPQLYLPLIGN